MHVNLIAFAVVLIVAAVIASAFTATLPLLFPVLAIVLAAHSVIDARKADPVMTDAHKIRRISE